MASKKLLDSKKEERWTIIYPILISILFWTLCWVVLK